MSDFTGKVVMVTGAAGSLGKAVAGEFTRLGAKLLLLDIDDATLARAFPGTAQAELLSVNLMDPDSVMAAVERGFKNAGRIDVLCNVAGGFRMGPPVHETPADMWQFMIGLNATSILNMAHAVVPKMLAAGGGKIVNVAARAGLAGTAQMGAYNASKSAVIRLTESMAAELREKNIHVNCVMPSIIDTPANRADMPGADFSKWVDAGALAAVIVFLASNAARAVPGAAIPVSGLN
jgi:NAD(P)-dependent dehydrogenase (short-subunit alcohol dehydrogenase family)